MNTCFLFFISELTYSHKIKLDDEDLTFELRDAIEKVGMHVVPLLCASIKSQVCLRIINQPWVICFKLTWFTFIQN